MNKVVVAKNLTLAYNSHIIIKDSDIEIKQKDFVVINGPSGSGKSTFLKSLYGDLEVSNGYLDVIGIEMGTLAKKKKLLLRRNIGIIFQDYKLIDDWSIERNIMLPLLINGYSKEVAKGQTEKLLAHINMSLKADSYPFELSGGEQQRVALARALAHNPVLILADEPTGNLDDYSSEVVWNLLKNANEQLGITVIAVSHRTPPVLSVNYRQFKITDGKIHEVA